MVPVDQVVSGRPTTMSPNPGFVCRLHQLQTYILRHVHAVIDVEQSVFMEAELIEGGARKLVAYFRKEFTFVEALSDRSDKWIYLVPIVSLCLQVIRGEH